jgi:hypothetical protein
LRQRGRLFRQVRRPVIDARHTRLVPADMIQHGFNDVRLYPDSGHASRTAATTITLQDGSTPLTGPMSLAAGVPLVLPFDSVPWFTSSLGNALNLVNGSAVQVSGLALYAAGSAT